MPRLEYPKHVYKGEDDERTSRVVKNAAEEAEAAEQGYEALPSAPEPPEAEQAAIEAQGAFLEYPKHVYRGEGEDRESIVVKDAEAEAAAEGQGYKALDRPSEDAPADEPEALKPPKAKKAPKTPKA
jgi:hypothetical protein